MLGSTGVQGSIPSTGNLIAVGADGRGGKIKVLRSLNQSSAVCLCAYYKYVFELYFLTSCTYNPFSQRFKASEI